MAVTSIKAMKLVVITASMKDMELVVITRNKKAVELVMELMLDVELLVVTEQR